MNRTRPQPAFATHREKDMLNTALQGTSLCANKLHSIKEKPNKGRVQLDEVNEDLSSTSHNGVAPEEKKHTARSIPTEF